MLSISQIEICVCRILCNFLNYYGMKVKYVAVILFELNNLNKNSESLISLAIFAVEYLQMLPSNAAATILK